MNPLVILLLILIGVVVLSITLYFIGVSIPKTSSSGMQGLSKGSSDVNAQASVYGCNPTNPDGTCKCGAVYSKKGCTICPKPNGQCPY